MKKETVAAGNGGWTKGHGGEFCVGMVPNSVPREQEWLF